ncbi:MAG: MCP four helix bundle domain-containing protein, partial [Cyclobacteriaceae bacterium]
MNAIRFFSQLKIRNKILVTFLLIFTLYLFNIIFNLASLSALEENISTIYNNRMLSIIELLEADRDSYQSRVKMAETITLKRSDAARYERVIKDNIVEIRENATQMEQRFNSFIENFSNDQKLKHPALTVYYNHFNQVDTLTEQIIGMLETNNFATARTVYHGLYLPNFNKMRGAVDELTQFATKKTSEEFTESRKTTADIMSVSYFFLVAMIIILIFTGIFLTRNIMQTLGVEPFEAALIATNMAEGNIGYELRKPTATGLYKDLKFMMMKLSKIIRSTSEISENLANASAQFTA